MHARRFMENLRLRTLRSRLEVFKKESSVFPRRAPEASAASRESATWGSDVELEAMESKQTGLAFSLPPSPEHVHANSPVEFTHYYFYPSPGARDTVSFGLDDILLTATSDSEDFGPALGDALPPSGQEARPSAAYSELVDVHSRSTEKLSLDWPDEPRESQALKLDERFLSGPNSRPKRRKLPFFSDLHQEISRSWKQPFSSRLTNAAAADFTNLVGSVEQGYTAIPVAEDTLASNLSPSLAPSWKSRPLLPTKLCRTTSALIGKSYIAAGQAGMALHTMAILQAYQVNVLKEMDEGTGLTPEAENWEKILPIAGVFWCCRHRLATSKQRISHWVRDAISLAYEARNLPSPLSLLAHSTRGVASSQALFRGVPLEDICVAAGWSSPHTFVRFYNLDIDTAPGSQVLSVWTSRIWCWFVIGPGGVAFLAWRVWYIVPKVWKLTLSQSVKAYLNLW